MWSNYFLRIPIGWAIGGTVAILALPSACIITDDDDDTSLDRDRPRIDRDAGDGDGDPRVDGGAAPDAGSERYVFRPDEVAPTPASISALRVPPGFQLAVFARDIGHARMLATRGSSVYVTRPMTGDVLRLTDTDDDGAADEQSVAISDMPRVHGIVFRGGDVYLATDKLVVRAVVGADGNFDSPATLIDDLPDGGQHPNRTLGIGPDDRLYISVGSSCDACAETNPEHATILSSDLSGANRAVFARGLRNTIGFGWHPDTGELWGMDHGSDWRGNDLPPEELNHITQGSDYGWPYCFGQRQIDPVIQDPPNESKAAYCARTAPATLLTRAHNAPIGLAFYTGTDFPASHRGSAFVAMRGSWNAYPPTGYKIMRVVFEDGVPTRFEDFVTGFLNEAGDATFARPAGITVASDGTLLFSDDKNGYVYRVSYGQSPVADGGAGDAGVPLDAAADAAP